LAAAHSGDLEGLVSLLSEDATLYGDGGGKATAFPRPLVGRAAVARALIAIFAQGERSQVRIEPATVNGQPGLLARERDGRLISVFCLDVVDGAIAAVRSVLNPDKLGHLGPLSSMALKRS
jgi:RNA polymerase sigma-70 factor (ECF subfamily)